MQDTTAGEPKGHSSSASNGDNKVLIKRIVKKKVVTTKPKTEQPILYLTDSRKRIGRDYEQWVEGSLIVTPVLKKKYKIARRIDDGHAGVVFKVLNKKGQEFALKVPKKDTEKQFRKLHQEVEKNKQLADLSLPYADIVEEGGDYLVKQWIEGVRGDEWFMRWNEKGRPLDDAPWKELIGMFDRLSSRGIYVQNLKDLNVIWDGSKWIVIDVGYFKYDMRPEEALGRFYETFDSRWNKIKYNKPRGPYKYNCPTIAEIRGQGPECYIKRPPEMIAKKRARMLARKKKIQQQGAEGQTVLMGLKPAATSETSLTATAVERVAPAGQQQQQEEEQQHNSKEEDASTEESKAGSESGEKTEEEPPKLQQRLKKMVLKEDISEREESEREAGSQRASEKKEASSSSSSNTTRKKKKGDKKKPKKTKSKEELKFVSITTDKERDSGSSNKKKKEKKKPAKKKRKKVRCDTFL